MNSTDLFTWLQDSDFYRDIHLQSINILQKNTNITSWTWLDVGCGPGILTRIAEKSGYLATGIDISERMIDRARAISQKSGLQSQYQCRDILVNPLWMSHDIVSGSSLLAVLHDKKTTLKKLYNHVSESWALMIIEPSENMNLKNVISLIMSKKIQTNHLLGLILWSIVRQNNIISETIYKSLETRNKYHTQVYHNLIDVYIYQK